MNNLENEAPVASKAEDGQTQKPYDFAPWKPPFHYFQLGTDIRDSVGQKCLDIRGWGFLTGRGGGLAMDEDKAEAIQDALGAHVVELLNVSSLPSHARPATTEPEHRCDHFYGTHTDHQCNMPATFQLGEYRYCRQHFEAHSPTEPKPSDTERLDWLAN